MCLLRTQSAVTAKTGPSCHGKVYRALVAAAFALPAFARGRSKRSLKDEVLQVETGEATQLRQHCSMIAKNDDHGQKSTEERAHALEAGIVEAEVLQAKLAAVVARRNSRQKGVAEMRSNRTFPSLPPHPIRSIPKRTGSLKKQPRHPSGAVA